MALRVGLWHWAHDGGSSDLGRRRLARLTTSSAAVELTNLLSPQSKQVLEYIDNLVCALFFVDFLHPLWRAKNRTSLLASDRMNCASVQRACVICG